MAEQLASPPTQDPNVEDEGFTGVAGGSRDDGLEPSGAELAPEVAVHPGAVPKKHTGTGVGAENGDGEAVCVASSLKDEESAAVALLRQLSESAARANAERSKRDVLLGKLEESITSLIEDWRPIRERVEEIVGNGGAGVADGAQCSIDQTSPDTVRANCIDAMIEKTVFDNSSRTQYGDMSVEENKFKARFRLLYEMIYDLGYLSAPVLVYLQSQPGVEIVVDCVNPSIFTALNVPSERRSKYPHSGRMFVDLKRNKLYFGGTNGNKPLAAGQRYYEQYTEREVGSFLAMGLAELATHLIFENGGRPFAVMDVETEHKLHKVFQAVEKEVKANARTHGYVRAALGATLQTQRESALVASVPGAAVERGSSDELWDCEVMPLCLLLFYELQVLGKLNEILKA